jgi:hypothetical protein
MNATHRKMAFLRFAASIPVGRRTLDLSFRGQKFKLSRCAFEIQSTVFQDQDWNANLVPLNDDVDIASMQTFLVFIHNDSFTITPQNYSDLRLLAVSWDVAQLRTALDAFIGDPTNAREIVIPSIISESQRGRSTQFEEQILSANLFDYLNDSKFLSLDLQVIHRIVDPKIAEIESPQVFPDNLFEFILKALKQIGSSASILLRNVSIEILSSEQLRIFVIVQN